MDGIDIVVDAGTEPEAVEELAIGVDAEPDWAAIVWFVTVIAIKTGNTKNTAFWKSSGHLSKTVQETIPIDRNPHSQKLHHFCSLWLSTTEIFRPRLYQHNVNLASVYFNRNTSGIKQKY